MANSSNLKDTMTNVAAALAGIGTLLAGLNVVALHLPVWVTAIGGALVGVAAVINGVYGGKNPDGSTKTTDQVIAQNPPKP
jgi:hypothetical protein